MFASGASQGVALAIGARPIAAVSPIAAVDATNTDMIRGIADNVTPFPVPHSYERRFDVIDVGSGLM